MSHAASCDLWRVQVVLCSWTRPSEFPAAFDAILHSVPPSLHLLSHSIYSLTAIIFQQSAETDKTYYSRHTHPPGSPAADRTCLMILSVSLLLGSLTEDKGCVEDKSLHNKRQFLIRSSIGTLIWFHPVFSPLQRHALEVNASIHDLLFLYHILYTACLQNRVQPKYRTACLRHKWSPPWSLSPRSSPLLNCCDL